MMRFSDQIREAIKGCGLSQRRLAQESGIEESSLSRFMRGEQGLTTSTLDAIAGVLRLEIQTQGASEFVLRRSGVR